MPMCELILRRVQNTERENERLLTVLKTVAKNIQESGIEQPSKCFFGCGDCGYPIDDCYNCPCHSWSPDGMPFTKCEII